MTGNVENTDGSRKEIKTINDIGSQARSKYFPSVSVVQQSSNAQ